jgi:N-acetylglucosamine malate deacetylase 2
MPEQKSKIHALVVVAHPDDESYLIGGTSLMFAEQKKNTVVVCATRGEKGSSHLSKPISKKALGKLRELELKKACRKMKVKEVCFLNFKDGELKNTDFKQLILAIVRKIDKYKPEVVITFGKEGITGHSDHIVIGECAVKAAAIAAHRPKETWRLSLPRSVIDDFEKMIWKSRAHKSHYKHIRLKGVPDNKLLWINIKKYSQTKLEAIYCHKSQGLPHWIRHKTPKLEKVFLHNEFFEVIKNTK